MLRINIHEAMDHLSKYLAKLKPGETILLCKRNVPVAEIRPIKAQNRHPRPIGLYKDRFTVPKSFFERRPDWLLDAFEGKPPK